MSSVVLNGNAYSDDGSQSRDMRNGGYRNWLLPMMADAAVDINIAKAAQSYASQASASASAAQSWADQVTTYAAASDATLFARAEQIKVAMEADPGNFSLSEFSWPSIYGE